MQAALTGLSIVMSETTLSSTDKRWDGMCTISSGARGNVGTKGAQSSVGESMLESSRPLQVTEQGDARDAEDEDGMSRREGRRG